MIPQSYICRSVEGLAFTGDLSTGKWADLRWTSDFVDIEGELKPLPGYRTRAKMAWDQAYFYVGAELEEPHVWATLTDHDSVIFQDNDFEVFIDPDGDSERYFEFEINALNTTWDLFLPKAYRDGGSADNSWETNAKSQVTIHGSLNDPSDVDRGWTVELAFPWKCFAQGGMPVPPDPGDVWRLNFSRVEWDVTVIEGKYVKMPNQPEHNWVWTPQGLIDMHQPEHWGYVHFKV